MRGRSENNSSWRATMWIMWALLLVNIVVGNMRIIDQLKGIHTAIEEVTCEDRE